jgi:hypothetical protein
MGAHGGGMVEIDKRLLGIEQIYIYAEVKELRPR